MKKILVINFRYFGDALISASLSVRIRELWPDAHITVSYTHLTLPTICSV